FSPHPADCSLVHDIIRGFCAKSAPANFEEAGCAVCGQLTLVSDLMWSEAVKNQLHILASPGVTRVE
ncbi:hypothetical protein L208DRAFT_1245678, partial [Tricholoma matsutake]